MKITDTDRPVHIVHIPDAVREEPSQYCLKQCVDDRAPMARCMYLKGHRGPHSWE